MCAAAIYADSAYNGHDFPRNPKFAKYVKAKKAPDAYPGYRMVFADEFNSGSKPNPEVWDYQVGFIRNKEVQYYQPQNVSVRGGNLVIEARKERVRNPKYQPGSSNWAQAREYADYTSGDIITRADRGYKWGQGIYEARIRIPWSEGLWPAFWQYGERRTPYTGDILYYTEIDIMEYYTKILLANVCWGSYDLKKPVIEWDSSYNHLRYFPDGFLNSYHVYRMVWDEEKILLYCDDRLLNEMVIDDIKLPDMDGKVYDYNPFKDPENRMPIIFNIAMGRTGGSLEHTPLPARMYVDYVRVYEKIAD